MDKNGNIKSVIERPKEKNKDTKDKEKEKKEKDELERLLEKYGEQDN